MKIGEISAKMFLLIIANDLIDTLAQLFMKQGVGHFDTFYFWAGILIYGFNFLLWMTVLAEVDLSVALPIGSVSYFLIPLAASAFIHEKISMTRWLALVFIIAGIYCISRSKTSRKQGFNA